MRRDLVRWALLPLMVALGVTIGYTVVGAAIHSPTGASGTGTGAGALAPGHTHGMAGMSDADMARMSASAVPAVAYQPGAGNSGSGAGATTRSGVVGVFVAINLAILAVAAIRRRRTARTNPTRRPAVRVS